MCNLISALGLGGNYLRKSWLDDEETARRYRMKGGTVWKVHNEYQVVACPHCRKNQYCRLTHIWRFGQKGEFTPEYHTNYHQSLEELKKLQVTYVGGVSVYETLRGNERVLMDDKENILGMVRLPKS